ncbi:MAG: sulfotransferase [Gemmatimonadota bacterium]
MAATAWRATLRECLGRIHREARITVTRIPRPDIWAFVVGCYNSGTELLAEILSSHPEIAALPTEGHFLTDQFPTDFELGLPRMWVLREDLFRLTERDEGPDPDRIKKEWGMRLDRSRPIFLEKSPPNTARTRWLQRHFSNAHFIAIVRNGYAVAEGIHRKAEPKHRRKGWPLGLCARQWARSNRVLLDDAAYLERIHWVRYEELTREPQSGVDEILRFLGLSPEGRGIDVSGAWAVHERNGPIRNLNPESLARLTPEDLQAVNREAEPMLRHFGYEVL